MENPVANVTSEPPASKARETVDIIAQINKLTQEDKILWRATPQDQTQDSQDDRVRPQARYEAEYKGNTLRLTHRQKKTYINKLFRPLDPSASLSVLRLIRPMYREKDTGREYFWQSELKLELLSPEGVVVWSPKYVSILEGLETSIQHQMTTSHPAYRDFVASIFAEG